ncbi:MAG: EsaB/YukD family protein [Lachnospiraceae bacterium]|nr:EsaB/YukD family protein [Lachnospiraceae bacterium]
MILVDLQVPVFDRVYDFELDEQLKPEELMKDILMLIGREEACGQSKEAGMALYAVRLERILDLGRTLHQQGVRDGDRLILI